MSNKNSQLNLYELHRKPLQLKKRSDKDNKISIKSSILESLLTCPICLDVLDHVMVTKVWVLKIIIYRLNQPGSFVNTFL